MLTKDEVVGSEELPERPGANAVHGSWFQVHQHGPGDIFMCCAQGSTHTNQRHNDTLLGVCFIRSLFCSVCVCVLTGGLVVVDIDPVQLQRRFTHIAAGSIDAMLIADHLPELDQREDEEEEGKEEGVMQK